jgi:F-type H+-transporting ATPase subunit b
MKISFYRRLGLVVVFSLFACVSLGVLSAQESLKPSAPAQSQPAEQKTQQEPVNPDAAVGRDLSNASEQAVKAEEGGGHEENAEFKYSAMVARLGRMVGIGPHGMYWVSLTINFIFLALFFWMLLRSKLPQMFRERTNTIQKALKEAQAASAEASRRLGDIEARLAKLDTQVSEIRAGAEREAAIEEERMRTAAEEDKRKIVDGAEAEIAAIARSARHDLKTFAASLAVDIAARKIKIDDNTDQALVREFVSHLGKDGE